MYSILCFHHLTRDSTGCHYRVAHSLHIFLVQLELEDTRLPCLASSRLIFELGWVRHAHESGY